LCGCGATAKAVPEVSTDLGVPETTQSVLSTETTEADEQADTITVSHCISICKNYLNENDSDAVKTVTNWNNPEVTIVEKLPDDYYKMSDDTNSEKYYKVVFTTTADELLGSIDFFVDETGNIIGQNYRE
jgi:glutamate synthase domain-containing protein 3